MRPVVTIPRVDRAPTLEDFADMKPANGFAQQLLKIDAFTQREPSDGSPATQRTEAYLGYDDKHLYVVFLAFDSEPRNIRARLARRENVYDDDLVQIMLDTFHDERRAYAFTVNPYGVQLDRLYAEGQGYDDSFDTVWASQGKLTGEGYVAWMAIPFRSLRFPPANGRWGIVLVRAVPRLNETVYWPYVSSRINGRLNQEASVEGLQRISPGRNIQLMPYGVYRSFGALDQRDPNRPFFRTKAFDASGGLDAKFVLKDRLVLDLTVNPDFSQVESDEPQTTVNERFEVFFPEKRPFFLENANYFSTLINFLFTRRIADPQFGARLTGKVGPYALGFLFADDQAPGRRVPDSDPLKGKRAYFGAVRINRDVGRSATVGMIYTERRFVNEYNRLGGADLRVRFGQNWTLDAQAVTSYTRLLDGTSLAGPAYAAYLEYAGRKLTFNTLFADNGTGLRTQPGFFRRPGIRRSNSFFRYDFRPEGKRLVNHGVGMSQIQLFAHDGARLERHHELFYVFNFRRQTELVFWASTGRERLRSGEYDGLTGDREYPTGHRGAFFTTQFFPQVTFSGEAGWGRAINLSPRVGPPVSARSNYATLQLTVRPTGRLAIENRYLFKRLRDVGGPHPIFNSHIIRSKWNYQITRELSVRFIAQYDALLVNDALSGLPHTKNGNIDFLVTYLLHPGTAVYVGYNSNVQNLDPSLTLTPNGFLRTRSRFANDSRQLFVKVSYLFRL